MGEGGGGLIDIILYLILYTKITLFQFFVSVHCHLSDYNCLQCEFVMSTEIIRAAVRKLLVNSVILIISLITLAAL
jgi:hypothetical protein